MRSPEDNGINIGFAELHCLSSFSFLQGASQPDELLKQADELGYTAIALTDECSVAGVVRAWEACRQHHLSVRLIVGSWFRHQSLDLVILARTRHGYGQLCRLISRARRRAAKGDYELTDSDFQPGAFSECLAVWHPSGDDRADTHWATLLQTVWPDRLWVAISDLLSPQTEAQLPYRYRLAHTHALPLIPVNQVHMHVPQRQMLQDTITAIRHGCTVQDAGFRLFPNAERHLRPLSRLRQLYANDLRQETLDVAAQCQFDLAELRYEYPGELVPEGQTAARYLRQLTREGQQRRYPQGTPLKVQAMIARELRLITELGYEHFFLTIEDLVRFARTQGILCQGRGSAANSAVCFCLGITEVDPTKATLLFERFISKERNEPPDIDVDFEHERREEVIQYVYRKYGRHRAALAATVITYRAKSAIRDVGKALGFDHHDLDQLVQNLDRRDKDFSWQDQLQQLRQPDTTTSPHGLTQRFLRLVQAINGFPRHLSQHVGGFVIAADHLDNLVPTENAAMAERTVIQWDKDDLEALDLLKVDILALGMLTAIRRCFQLCTGYYRQPFDMNTVTPDDPATYAMLQRADSIGVFQVESRAQMSMLPRLRPACFYDLVVQIAIVRPGPIQGDMVHPYLLNREHPQAVTYPNEAIRQVLSRTFGVPIFQEQVIALAMAAAGFSAGEADQLRRAMASWKRHGHMETLQARLIEGMRARGHEDDFAQRICRQIQGFGEYGFPESHAASFALLAYVSAWLKCHYPAAFCCALLNSQPMGFYSPSQLIQDVRRHQVKVLPVDINTSDWSHSLTSDPDQPQTDAPPPAIRLGFRLIKGISKNNMISLLAQRPASGFSTLSDIQALDMLNQKDWAALASAGALKSLAGHRYQARWAVLGRVPASPLLQSDLFADTPVSLQAPSEGENTLEDYHSLGLTLERHPIEILRAQGRLEHMVRAEVLAEATPHSAVSVCGLVTGRQRPGTASGVTFVTLEDETGNVNVIVWKQLAQQQRKVLLLSRVMEIRGQLERQGDVIHVIARQLIDRSAWLHDLQITSRDFH